MQERVKAQLEDGGTQQRYDDLLSAFVDNEETEELKVLEALKNLVQDEEAPESSLADDIDAVDNGAASDSLSARDNLLLATFDLNDGMLKGLGLSKQALRVFLANRRRGMRNHINLVMGTAAAMAISEGDASDVLKFLSDTQISRLSGTIRGASVTKKRDGAAAFIEREMTKGSKRKCGHMILLSNCGPCSRRCSEESHGRIGDTGIVADCEDCTNRAIQERVSARAALPG